MYTQLQSLQDKSTAYFVLASRTIVSESEAGEVVEHFALYVSMYAYMYNICIYTYTLVSQRIHDVSHTDFISIQIICQNLLPVVRQRRRVSASCA